MFHQHENHKQVSNRKYRAVSILLHQKIVHSDILRTYFS